MEHLMVSGKELMLLATRLGGTTFYGIRDPFGGMNTREVHMLIPQLERSLEEKHLASVGFDDSFTVAPRAAELVSVCARCQVYLCAGALHGLSGEPPYRWYGRDGSIVELRQEEDNYSLRKAAPNAVLSSLLGLVGQADNCSLPMEDTVLSYGDFFAAQQEPDDNKARTLLTEAGCCEAAADVLLDGLRRRGDFCAITATDIEQRQVNGLMIVRGAHGRLRIRQTDGCRGWQVTAIDRETLEGEIAMLATMLSGGKGKVNP